MSGIILFYHLLKQKQIDLQMRQVWLFILT